MDYIINGGGILYHLPWPEECASGLKRKFELKTLRGADLSGKYLRRVLLSGKDLREANFAGADLRESYLWDADLRGADLRGANLRGSDITREQLASAITDQTTRFPAHLALKAPQQPVP